MEQIQNLPALNVSDEIPVQDIIDVALRLTHLMADEAEYFRTMDVSEISALQEEKNHLLIWLEAQQKMLAVHPDPTALIDADEHAALEEVMAEFTAVAKDNFQQATIARDVNQKVVEAVTMAIRNQEMVQTYNVHGDNRSNNDVPISYKLNQSA